MEAYELSYFEKLERETGLEPATSSLGSWHSTTELLPHSSDFTISSRCLFVDTVYKIPCSEASSTSAPTKFIILSILPISPTRDGGDGRSAVSETDSKLRSRTPG